MKALFIGGTGTISAAITRRLARDPAWEVWLLNRGNRSGAVPEGVHSLIADISDEAAVREKLGDMTFDVVGEFIGFTQDQVERDVRLFRGRTKQYIYISSASAYHKPAADFRITEGTTLANPHWQYSRDKIACEEYLMARYREEGFPVTIVRPSHTYDERYMPVGVHGAKGPWQVIQRIREGKPVLSHGDGSSLWHLTYNEDFATGYIGLMGNRHALGEAFHITGDEVLTWNQIYASIADALGTELKPYYVSSAFLAEAGKKYGYDFEGGLIGDKAVSVCFDNTKVKRLSPALTTTVPFHRGARIVVDYMLSHPECQVADPEFDAWCDRVIAALEKAKAEI